MSRLSNSKLKLQIPNKPNANIKFQNIRSLALGRGYYLEFVLRFGACPLDASLLEGNMHMALFGARSRAGCAADAVLRPGDGHDLVLQIIAELVIALKGFFDQLEHVETAYLITPAAADALVDLDRVYEFRDPGLAAPGRSGYW
jgi:hypothetical protein